MDLGPVRQVIVVSVGIVKEPPSSTTSCRVLTLISLQYQPRGRAPLREAELDEALEFVADYADLKSAWFTGHSRGVASPAAAAALILLSRINPLWILTAGRALGALGFL